MSNTKKQVKKAAKTTAKAATRAVGKTGEYAASNPKGAFYVGLGLFLFIGGFALYRKLNPKPPELPDFSNDGNYPPPTISDAQAQLIAERLYAAMNQSGTDEDEVYDAVTGLTINDFHKVYQAFGYRRYSIQFGNNGLPFVDDDHDLISWLSHELDTSELNHFQSLIPGLQFS